MGQCSRDDPARPTGQRAPRADDGASGTTGDPRKSDVRGLQARPNLGPAFYSTGRFAVNRDTGIIQPTRHDRFRPEASHQLDRCVLWFTSRTFALPEHRRRSTATRIWISHRLIQPIGRRSPAYGGWIPRRGANEKSTPGSRGVFARGLYFLSDMPRPDSTSGERFHFGQAGWFSSALDWSSVSLNHRPPSTPVLRDSAAQIPA